MNRVPVKVREQALKMLVEGASMRATSRATGMAFNSVRDLIVTSGRFAWALHDKYVRDVEVSTVQADEMWAFCYSRRKRAKGQHDWSGDLWTWTAIDRDSKLLIAWVTGDRGAGEARYLMSQLKERIKGKIRLTTDGYWPYPDAISWAGIDRRDLEYAKIVKVFAGVKNYPTDPDSRRNRYKESVMTLVHGDPNEINWNDHGTTFIERHNLTLRMGMRRLMRSNNGHSKKRANHNYMTALYMMYYNFIRPHMTLTEQAGGKPTTPTMAAGILARPFSFRQFLEMTDELTKPKPRGPYHVPYRPRKTATKTRRETCATRPVPSKVPVAVTGDASVVRVVQHDFATRST